MKSSHAEMITSKYWVIHWQTILKLKLCVSISPSSEVIVDVKLSVLALGFKNTLSNVTEELFPVKVILFPSAGLVAITETPPVKLFETSNVPKTNPEVISIDSTITWLEDTIELTNKSVVNEFVPAIKEAKPIAVSYTHLTLPTIYSV